MRFDPSQEHGLKVEFGEFFVGFRKADWLDGYRLGQLDDCDVVGKKLTVVIRMHVNRTDAGGYVTVYVNVPERCWIDGCFFVVFQNIILTNLSNRFR